jgi:crotonobetainyl-CoA:carnitine CoA-transferase CaiB-like acyl-CoA transferase
VCDPLAGIHAAFATLAALYRQRRTGLGGHVEVSMLEPAAYAAVGQSLAWQIDRERVDRIGNRDHHHSPHGVYPTAGKDEWVCIAVQTADEWVALAHTIGRPDLAGAPWLDVAYRIANADEIDAAIAQWTATRSATAALDALATAKVPSARVDGAGRLLQHPQLEHRAYFEYVDHPIAGRHPIPGLPYRSTAQSGPWNRTPAPTLGQHTDEVMREWLGMSDEDIARLYHDGVSGTRPDNL